jgi:hypothetical protein
MCRAVCLPLLLQCRLKSDQENASRHECVLCARGSFFFETLRSIITPQIGLALTRLCGVKSCNQVDIANAGLPREEHCETLKWYEKWTISPVRVHRFNYGRD